jgi:hypothetical protein
MKFAKVLQKTSVLFFLLGFLFLLPKNAFSQIETPDFTTGSQSSVDPASLSIPAKIPGLQEQVDVSVFPENPKPGDEVTIVVNTYGIDINTNLIVWKVNNKEALKGIGQKKFVFKVGNTGTATKVDLSVFPKNGPVIEKSFSFTPIDVDILWQAKTYTPPFYKGKALYTPESEVVFTSLPNISINGTKIDPTDVVYKWKLNYDLENDVSGFGKNSYLFKGPIILRENLIESNVYAASSPEIQGTNKINLTNSYPAALVYEDSPLLGVLFNKAIKNEYGLKDNEVKLAAYPFYFSTANKNSVVNYKWNIDEASLGIPQNQNSVIFRKVSNIKGSAGVNVTIGNESHILQQASTGFEITYDTINASNK